MMNDRTEKSIFVLGANPAWQKTLRFGRFGYGVVNRAASMEAYPAGKGVNVCRAACCFGETKVRLFQFAGGHNGECVCRALKEAGIDSRTVRTTGETRICTTCLDDTGATTELIEPSHALSESEMNEMLELLRAEINDASMLVLSGSLPDGTPDAFYSRAAAVAADAGVPVLADIVRGVSDVMNLPTRIILKVNDAEIRKITGKATLDDALDAAESAWPNAVLAITGGEKDSVLLADHSRFLLSPCRLDHVVSTLGCGDTATAVLSVCLTHNLPLEQAFLQALAAASANCLSPMAADFSRDVIPACMGKCRRLRTGERIEK